MKKSAKFKKSRPKQKKITIQVSWKSLIIILTIIRLRQEVWEQFILFEALLIDDFSTDRIIYDKIANIEERESNLINFLRNVQWNI